MASKYLKLTLNGKQIDIEDAAELPFTIDYQLESEDDFQQKKSSQALAVSVPATLDNDRVLGSFHNPEIESEEVKTMMTCVVEANGSELLKGKALLRSASQQNGKPTDYKLDCYGNNGDWIIALQDATLHDFISSHTHILEETTLFNSWLLFDGRSEELDYVYAPVRYGTPFPDNDTSVTTLDLCPSISLYWIIYRAFKSLGYRLDSEFFDTDFFRKQVMPWTWGDFLLMNSSAIDPLKFKATGTPFGPPNPDNDGDSWWSKSDFSGDGTYYVGTGTSGSGAIIHNSWDMAHDIPPLGFDNGGNYSYIGGSGVMRYVFNSTPADLLGVTNLVFRITLSLIYLKSSTMGSAGDANLYIDYTVTGGAGGSGEIFIASAQGVAEILGDEIPTTISVDFTVPNVQPGSTITFIIKDIRSGATIFNNTATKIYARKNLSTVAGPLLCESFFEIVRFEKTVGSIVDLKIYDEFKNYKFLDFLRGIIDLSDCSIQTDNINKVIKMEPTFTYSLTNDPNDRNEGYFSENKLNWTEKQDLSKPSTLDLYSDIEQQLNFTFKDDGNNGGVKIFNERNSVEAGSSRYLFPDRFKQGKKDNENRFFGSVVHYDMEQWKQFSTGQSVAPQIIALIPENVSNTSADATKSKFTPCVAWYRGMDVFESNGQMLFNGNKYLMPTMLAVNYKPGGEFDPVLTYGDQKINGVIVPGLMRRFFLPRLAMMRYGKKLTASFMLNNADVTNWYHREKIIIDGSLYFLFNIDGYKPLTEESTSCLLWKYFPVTQEDGDSCFPSKSSVEGTGTISGSDISYNPLLLLQKDIPQ